MGIALLECIFSLSPQIGLGAHDLDFFQVNLKCKMLQKRCRNTPNVLQTLMDQMVHGMWQELVWSKCLEITLVFKRGPWQQLFHFIDPLLLGDTIC